VCHRHDLLPNASPHRDRLAQVFATTGRSAWRGHALRRSLAHQTMNRLGVGTRSSGPAQENRYSTAIPALLYSTIWCASCGSIRSRCGEHGDSILGLAGAKMIRRSRGWPRSARGSTASWPRSGFPGCSTRSARLARGICRPR
jgi:hypothetical protein